MFVVVCNSLFVCFFFFFILDDRTSWSPYQRTSLVKKLSGIKQCVLPAKKTQGASVKHTTTP